MFLESGSFEILSAAASGWRFVNVLAKTFSVPRVLIKKLKMHK